MMTILLSSQFIGLNAKFTKILLFGYGCFPWLLGLPGRIIHLYGVSQDNGVYYPSNKWHVLLGYTIA